MRAISPFPSSSFPAPATSEPQGCKKRFPDTCCLKGQGLVLAFIIGIGCGVLGAKTVAVAADNRDEPEELTSLRQAYESDFLREVQPLQVKYQKALENFMRSFTQNGDLVAGKEASEEIERSKMWQTIPTAHLDYSLANPQLLSLQASYDKAVLKVVDRVVNRYADELKRLKEHFKASGKLDYALLIDKELKIVQAGGVLPTEAGARQYLSGFSKVEFKRWLQEQTFEFSGAISGRTPLRFDVDRLYWGSGEQPRVYEYSVSGSRSVSIKKGVKKGGFDMKFSRDLHSATFTSNNGDYPVIINPVAKGKK